MSELDRYFVYQCEKGLQTRGLAGKIEYIDRLHFETETIIKMGFPGYFLIMWDLIGWAKRQGIYIGPGRGSAAGCLASYCLYITDLDPIHWDLLFERFLNPDRISMPDIDFDIEKSRRDEVIQYAIDKYDTDKVAHIGTFGTMRAKGSVKNVTKTLGYDYKIGHDITKLLLADIHGKPQPLSASMEKVTQLAEYMETDTPQRKVLQWAEKLENRISNVGVHASGVVISNTSLLDTVPLFRGKGDEITTQWEMNNIEEVGLIKFDFLGLAALTRMRTCVELVKERHGVQIDINNLDLEDEKTLASLRAGEAVGVFQLEASSGMRDLLVQIRPTSVEDLVALVAIYRPGPLDSSYKQIYLDVRAEKREPEYLVPELEPILKRTSGWLIYQEQIMEICKQLCGYTGGEADEMRKAVGKKKQALMDKHEPKFKEGWIKNSLSKETADQLWSDIVVFAAYGFNRSHAAAYAMITYQTAYLKAHYPVEFMCAAMTTDSGDTDQIIKFLSECKRLGINVKPPDINRSHQSFHVDDDGDILFGLGPIKNLGASAEKITEEREKNGPFKSFREFCDRVDIAVVNRKKIESLVRAGAFDYFGHTRGTLLGIVEPIWEYRSKHTKSYISKKATYEKKKAEAAQRVEDIEAGELSAKGKKLRPLKVPDEPQMPIFPEMIELDELVATQIQRDEHELLGFYVSSHPLDGMRSRLFGQNFSVLDDVKQMPDKTLVSIAAVVSSNTEITTKRKTKMAFLALEDLTGSIEATVFPNVYKKHTELLTSEEIHPLRFEGTVEVTEVREKRVTKIIVRDVGRLSSGIVKTERIEVTAKASRAKEVADLLSSYAGDTHEVSITFETQDGTKLRCPDTHKIANRKGAFLREILRINNDA